MANFTARVSAGGSTVPWVDPPDAARPSRLNAERTHPPNYVRLVNSGLVTFLCTVNGGTEAPLDGALGGKLFVHVWAEWSGLAPANLSSPAGQSSVIHVVFDAAKHAGHHLLSIRRPGGGAVNVPIEVELVL